MTKPIISIIVPVYNCEKYIGRLINSVLVQSYPNFELIILNDGSTDNTKEKIEEFKDIRISVINKENTGVSDTRNEGIKLAKGKYICFLDSDDYIDQGYFEAIINYFKEYPNLELLNFGFYSDIENENLKETSSDIINYKESFYQNREEIKNDLVNLWDSHMLYNPVNKVYLSKIIKDNSIQFPEYNWGEDIEFNRRYVKHINNLYNSSLAFYHYIREREGASTKNYKNNLLSIRKKEYDDFNAYFDLWGVPKEEYIEFSSRRHIERILGCIENTFCSNMSFKDKYREIKMIVNDDLTRRTLKVAKPKSKKTKIALIPIRLKSTLLTMLMGKLFHYIKSSHPNLFNKLKNRR